MQEELEEIIKFYSEYNFADFKPITIDGSNKVIDLRTFVRSHVLLIRKNIKKDIAKPYFDRLKKVYLISKI